MPKVTKRRSGHVQSVKLATRKFAADGNVEHIDIGSRIEASGNELLAQMAEAEEDASKPMKKKEKQAMKHELFMQRLEASRSPYSKSHERRLKRKVKEQVASGMDDVQAALCAVAKEMSGAADDADSKDDTDNTVKVPPKPKPGQIGEGKKESLNNNQRQKALKTERIRIPMILANPQFASNPFQTIRTHAQNTLIKHQKAS